MKKLLTCALVIGALVAGLGALIPAASAVYTPTAGDIIKINATDRSAVYVVGSDLKPYVFSTRNTYGTWYSDFSPLKNITQADFDTMTMGGNVTVRPGSLIKFDNSDNTYAVISGNKLCKLPAIADAKVLYGADYAARVLLIQVAFISNYNVDPACTLTRDSKLPDGSLIQYAGSSDTYYIENGQKRLVGGNAFSSNQFKSADIVKNVSMSMSYEAGEPINNLEEGLISIKLTNKDVTAPIQTK